MAKTLTQLKIEARDDLVASLPTLTTNAQRIAWLSNRLDLFLADALEAIGPMEIPLDHEYTDVEKAALIAWMNEPETNALRQRTWGYNEQVKNYKAKVSDFLKS